MKGVKNYLKNVTKSFTYMAADTATGMMPNVKEFTEANQEAFKVGYETIRNPRAQVRRAINAVKESKVYEAAQYGAKNALEDLKSGNWYNKAREEEDSAKFMGSAMDVSNWNDLSEFGIDADWEKNLDKEIAGEEVTAGDLKIIDSVERSNAALANTTANAVVTAADYQAKTSKINTSILFSQNERLFGGLHKDFSTLNTTMANLYGMHDNVFKNIDKNMSDYFTRKVKHDKEMNAMLKEMLEMQRNTYKSAQQREQEEANKKSKTANSRWSDINVAGLPRIEDYFKSIKGNINKMIESQTGMMNMFGEDSNMLASFMASPLKYAVEFVTKNLVPAATKLAAEELDKSLSGVFGNFVARMTNFKDSDGPLSFLGKIFGVNASTSKDVDTSKYYKGAIPFDGLTRKAIMDVIPTYLRRIDAHLSGQEELIFDYNSGKWKKTSSLKKELDSIKENRIKSATSDLMYEMRGGIKKVRSDIKGDKTEFDEAIKEFQKFLYDRNGDFNPNKSADANNISAVDYPNLAQYYDAIVTIFKTFDVDEKTGRNRKLSSRYLGGKVLEEKDREKQQYTSIGSSPENVLGNLFNGITFNEHGSIKDGKFNPQDRLLRVKDSFGNNIYDYLQTISSELQWQRDVGFEYLASSNIRTGGHRVSKIAKDTSKTKNVKMSELDKTLSSVRNSKAPVEDFREKTRRAEELKKKIEKEVAEGKAVYLSGMEEEDRETLETLAIMMQKEGTSDYEKELKSIANSSALSKYLNKKFYDFDGRFKELDKVLDEEELDKREEQEAKKEKRNILDKFGFITKARDVIGNIATAPVEVFTNLLESADRAVYQMMFKSELKDDKDGKTYDNFMDMLAGRFGELTEKIGGKINDILDPIKEKFGLGDGNFKERTTDAIKTMGKNAFNMIIDANKEVYSPGIDFVKNKLGLEDDKKTKYKVSKELLKSNNLSEEQKQRNTAFKQLIQNQKELKEQNALDEKDKIANKMSSTRLSIILRNKDPKEMEDYVSNILGYDSVEKKRQALTTEFGYTLQEVYRKNLTSDDLNVMILRSKRKVTNYASGTLKGASPYVGRTMLSKGEMLFNNDGVSVVNRTDAYDVSKPTHILSSYQSYPILKKMGLASGDRKTPTEDLREENRVKSRILNKATGTIMNHAEGTPDIEKQAAKIAGSIDKDDILDAIKQNAPEGVAGGVVGGIVSTLLGIVGGPLLGMTIGAAGSIIANSEGLKNALFGIKSKDGKREGGIVSEKIVDAAHHYVPGIMKYGLAGIIPGLITPLGPLGGMLAGGVIGFLKSNEEFKDKYFGPGGKLMVNDKTKNTIKKMLPNAGIGAGAGAVISVLFGGPFGLLGNAALGGALGLMSSTEEFKNGILGKTVDGVHQGGLLGTLRQAFGPLQGIGEEIRDKFTGFMDENVFSPLQRFINPFLKDLPHLAGTLPRLINRAIEGAIGYSITDIITKKIAGPFAKYLRKTLEGKGLLGRTVGVAGKIVTSPFRALGGLGDMIQSRRITKGREDQMTAQERIDWLEHNKRGDKVSKMDQYLAGIGDVGSESYNQAKKASQSINEAFDNTYEVEAERSKVAKQLLKRISKFTTQDGGSFTRGAEKKIKEAIKANRIDTAYEIMRTTILSNNRQLTESEFKLLTTGKDENGESFADIYKRLQDLTERKNRAGNLDKKAKDLKFKEFAAQFKKQYGREPKNQSELRDYANLINTELRNREAKKKETDPLKEANEKIKDATAQTAQNTSDMLKELINISEAIKNNARGTTGANADYKDALDRNISNATSQSQDYYEQRRNDIKDEVGEGFEDLTEETVDSVTGKAKAFGDKFRSPNNKGKEPALIVYMQQGIISKKQANLIKGGKNVDQIANLLKNHKYELSDDAIVHINGLSNERANVLLNIFNGKGLLKLYGKSTITKKDCVYAIKHFITKDSRKKFNKFCFALIDAGAKPGFFKSLEEINTSSPSAIANEQPNFTMADEPIENNGLGTMLLGGIGKVAGSLLGGAAKAVGKGALSLGKKAVGGIKSLFSGKGDGESSGGIKDVSDVIAASGESRLGIGGPTNSDIDKPGDDKIIQYVPEVNSYMYAKKGSDGDISPDTSESTTKETLRKLTLKEKAQNAFQNMQSKAMDTLHRAFNTDDEKDSKKGKLSWWKLLLAGIVGLPVLKSLFEKVLTPLWDNVMKPGLSALWNEILVPAIGSVWTGFKSFMSDTAFPWLTGTGEFVGNGLPTILGNAISGALLALPSILGGLFDGIKTVIGNIALPDSAKNAPSSTTVDPNKQTSAPITVRDPNGKLVGDKLSGNQLTSYTGSEGYQFYNEEGELGTVNKDGSITFRNTDNAGKEQYETATKRGMLQSAIDGSIGPIGTALDKFGSRLFRNADETTLLGKAGKTVGKYMPNKLKMLYQGGKRALGVGIKAATMPGKVAADTGDILGGFIKSDGNLLQRVGAGLKNGKYTGEIADKVGSLYTSAKTKASDFIKNASSKATSAASKVQDAVKMETGLVTAADAAKVNKAEYKDTGLISKLIAKAKEAINKVLENKKVQSFIGKFASDSGKDGAALVVQMQTNMNNVLEQVIQDGNKVLAKEAMESTVKVFLKKVLAIATIGFDFAYGYDNSEAILGVEETTFIESLCCGVMNALMNLVPFLTLLITVDKLSQMLAKLFDKEGFEERQEEANAETAKYNEETGNTLSTKERLQKDNLTYKVGQVFAHPIKSIKKGMTALKDKLSGFTEGASELGGKIVSGAKDIGGKVVGGVKAAGGWLKDRGMDLYNATGFSEDTVRSRLGLNEDAKVTFGNRVATTLGSAAGIFGFDTTEATKIFNGVGVKVNDFAKSVSNNVKKGLDSANTKIGGWFGYTDKDGKPISFTDGVKQNAKLAKDSIVDAWNDTRTNFSNLYNGLKDKTKDTLKNIGDGIKDGATKLNNTIGGWFGFTDEDGNATSFTSGVAKGAVGFKDYVVEKSIQLKKDFSKLYTNMKDKTKDLFKSIGDNLKKGATKLNEKIGGWFGFEDDDGNPISFTKGVKKKTKDLKDSVMSTLDKVKTSFSNFWNGLKDSLTSASDDAVKEANAGAGKYGRAKQIDPAIANIRYNAPGDKQYQTIGDSGCGPAAAVTAVQSAYGRGNDVVDAAKLAIRSGYKEKDGGTKPGFFKKYFNQNGLDSTITYSKAEIERNLRSGNPTVLMGKDPAGVSPNTPYGTNPHYVTVTGMRGDKVVVQDPESKYDDQVYDIKDVLNKSSIGISAYGKAKRAISKYGRSKYGMGLRGATVNEQIYNFFIDNGFTGQAAAGILGNMTQEAGLDSNGQINLHATESTGEGIGIVQWSHGRKTAFKQFCNSIGQPWPTVTLDSQLQYIMHELQNGQWMFASGFGYPSKYKMSYEDFKKQTDIGLATGGFCANYERCRWVHAHMDDVRIPKAKEFYEQFSGNKAQAGNASSNTSGSTTDGSSGGTSGGVIGSLVNLFTSAMNNSGVGQAMTKIGNLTSSAYDYLFGSKTAEASSDNTNGSTSTGGPGSSYPKYTGIDDSLKRTIAGVIVGETGGDDLVAAKQEASQMANLNEVTRKRNATGADLYKTLTSGWYAKSSFGKTPTEASLKAVEDVLINGQRTLPRYVTEHDMFPLDAAMDGSWYTKGQDRSKYIRHQTTIKQNPNRFPGGGASYQFYDFFGQNKDGDVAGYYSQDYEKYKEDTAWGAGGNRNKMVSKYGNAKQMFGYQKSDYGKGSGHKIIKRRAEDIELKYAAMNNRPEVPLAPSDYGKATTPSIDYTELIKVIIETLLTIADNSDKLNTIVTLLQNNLGASITSKDVKAANNSVGLRQRLQNALSKTMQAKDSGQDNSILSIINAMNAIASE